MDKGDVMVMPQVIFFYFLVYSFLGWLIEGLFNLVTRGCFSKANFLSLPFKPMYGIAAILLIRLQILLPTWLFLICCLVVPTVVEYLSAFLLLHTFNLRYWNYGDRSYQLSGFICLRFSIYWFFLSLVLIYLIQPMVVMIYHQMQVLWFYFFPIFLLLFLTDFFLTIKTKHLATH